MLENLLNFDVIFVSRMTLSSASFLAERYFDNNREVISVDECSSEEN